MAGIPIGIKRKYTLSKGYKKMKENNTADTAPEAPTAL